MGILNTLRLVLMLLTSSNFLGYQLVSGKPGDSSITDNSGVKYSEGPRFATEGRTFRAVTKDTIVLPCDVQNQGKYVLAWKWGNAILTAASIKVTPDDRYRLVDGYNLEIRDVQNQDAGDYVCQIATLKPMEITHVLEIQVPPHIHRVPSEGFLSVDKGTTAILECRASGNPVPTVTWTRKNNVLPSGDQSVQGTSLTIEQVNRYHAGLYQCTANNGVGKPASAEITVEVKFSPEIEVEKKWVHTGEGYEAQLVCVVHAEPSAIVIWYRDTLLLDTTDNHLMEAHGTRHRLVIRKVQAQDFGNYSCSAENSVGKTRQYLELSGKPNPAVFTSQPAGKFRDRYNLTWTVNSYTPIEEFKLYYRRAPKTHIPGQISYNQGHSSKRHPAKRQNETWVSGGNGPKLINEWNDVILPASPSDRFTHHMSYVIRGLEPSYHYEARVQAKNRFGWNHISEIFQFVTRGEESNYLEPSPEPAIFSDAEMRDMGVRVLGGTTSLSISNCLLLLSAFITLFVAYS